MPQPSSQSHTGTRGPLAEAIIALAGTPDDMPSIDVHLNMLVQLAADRVAAADYASVTALHDDAYTTVAASSALAEAVDQAQNAGQDGGPCVQSLNTNVPVTVPDMTKTMAWPRFRETAADLGLRASVSIPVFAGSGSAIAGLNLYGRDPAAMAPLIIGVWAVYYPGRSRPTDHGLQPLDAGGEELLAGFAEALTVRATIQTALGVIMGRTHITAEGAYLRLRLHAAGTGISLLTAANTLVITQGR
jgi:hypothetical protein